MTKQEILIQVANDHSYESWGELMYDTHEHSQIEYTCEAMEIYAQSKIKEAQQIQWISAGERLPRDHEDCIIFTSQHKVQFGYVIKYPGGHLWRNCYELSVEVTHWQTLPSPPQE